MLEVLYWGYFLNHFEMDKTDLNLMSKRMSLKVPICLQFLAHHVRIDNFSIISSGAMNAKLSL